MFRPLISLLHRSGLFSHLRDQWRADDVSSRQALKEFAAREARGAAAELRAELKGLRAELKALRAELESRYSLREDTRELRQDVRRLGAILTTNSEQIGRAHV